MNATVEFNRTKTTSHVARNHVLSAYWKLTKPRGGAMILLMTAAGFVLATPFGAPLDGGLLARTLLGVLVLWSGIAALNQWMERERDALMERTRNRPLPSGELPAVGALRFGVALTLSGLATLAWGANPAAALVGAFVVASYLGVYTPLKARSTAAAFWGAFPGAAPPLLGWAAASGSLEMRALIPFALLFLWQFPHLHAIAWRYRDDYARAGMKMAPAVAPCGLGWRVEIALCSVLLLPVGQWPVAARLADARYGIVALMLGVFYAAASLHFSVAPDQTRARRLIRASVLYLPLLFIALLWGR